MNSTNWVANNPSSTGCAPACWVPMTASYQCQAPSSAWPAPDPASASCWWQDSGGEYVSVNTQRDTEEAMLAKERWELANCWDDEVEELAQIYETKGITKETAHKAALEAMHTDALYAHATDELRLDPTELVSPWNAAFSSFLSFTIGGLIPLLFALLPMPVGLKIACIVIAAALALCLTGFTSAKLGGADWKKAVLRNVGMGLGTMLFSWLVGLVFNVSTGA